MQTLRHLDYIRLRLRRFDSLESYVILIPFGCVLGTAGASGSSTVLMLITVYPYAYHRVPTVHNFNIIHLAPSAASSADLEPCGISVLAVLVIR
jgi:hypothetical protein